MGDAPGESVGIVTAVTSHPNGRVEAALRAAERYADSTRDGDGVADEAGGMLLQLVGIVVEQERRYVAREDAIRAELVTRLREVASRGDVPVDLVEQTATEAIKALRDEADVPAPASTIAVPTPVVPFGPKGVPEHEATASYLRGAADRMVAGYKPGGSNVAATLVRLARDAADALDRGPQSTPVDEFAAAAIAAVDEVVLGGSGFAEAVRDAVRAVLHSAAPAPSVRPSLAEFVAEGVCLSCGGAVLENGEHADPDRHLTEDRRVRTEVAQSFVDVMLAHAALDEPLVRQISKAAGYPW